MTDPSTLREALHDELIIFANNAMNADVKYITEARNRSRDAILDAVIARLPEVMPLEEGDELTTRYWYKTGVNEAIAQVQALLQSAKGGTDFTELPGLGDHVWRGDGKKL